MTYEDFTTFTEVDPGDDITVITNTITATGMSGITESYVKKGYGANHFGNFEHLHKFSVTQVPSFVMLPIWLITSSDTIRTRSEFQAGADGILLVYYYDMTYTHFYIVNGVDNSNDFTALPSTLGTWWCTSDRTATTATCKIYTDAARTNLHDTIALSVPTTPYQYLIALSSMEDPSCGPVSATSEDLDLQEVPPPAHFMQPRKYW